MAWNCSLLRALLENTPLLSLVFFLYNFLKEVISSNILVVKMLLKRLALFFPFSFCLVQMTICFLEMSAIWAEVNMTVRRYCMALRVFGNREEQFSEPSVKADF